MFTSTAIPAGSAGRTWMLLFLPRTDTDAGAGSFADEDDDDAATCSGEGGGDRASILLGEVVSKGAGPAARRISLEVPALPSKDKKKI